MISFNTILEQSLPAIHHYRRLNGHKQMCLKRNFLKRFGITSVSGENI